MLAFRVSINIIFMNNLPLEMIGNICCFLGRKSDVDSFRLAHPSFASEGKWFLKKFLYYSYSYHECEVAREELLDPRNKGINTLNFDGSPIFIELDFETWYNRRIALYDDDDDDIYGRNSEIVQEAWQVHLKDAYVVRKPGWHHHVCGEIAETLHKHGQIRQLIIGHSHSRLPRTASRIFGPESILKTYFPVYSHNSNAVVNILGRLPSDSLDSLRLHCANVSRVERVDACYYERAFEGLSELYIRFANMGHYWYAERVHPRPGEDVQDMMELLQSAANLKTLCLSAWVKDVIDGETSSDDDGGPSPLPFELPVDLDLLSPQLPWPRLEFLALATFKTSATRLKLIILQLGPKLKMLMLDSGFLCDSTWSETLEDVKEVLVRIPILMIKGNFSDPETPGWQNLHIENKGSKDPHAGAGDDLIRSIFT